MLEKPMAKVTIGVAGAGGDGVVVLGTLLQKVAALQGYCGQMSRYYGAQIRGGGSAIKLSLDAEGPSLPADRLDILVCFDWNKYSEFREELPISADTLILAVAPVPTDVASPVRSFVADFSGKSEKLTGSSLDKNIVALGLLSRVLSFPEEVTLRPKGDDKELTLLRQKSPLLKEGARLSDELSLPGLRLRPRPSASPPSVLSGNQAMALAAVRGGCRAFFAYPITPAWGIMEEMQKQLPGRNGVCAQTEDEIAAIGMALGASMVGAKSMTATSGPGFDLMTEVMDLATMAEIPVVIIDVQRCGPATGIPSKSEQSDLNHALYGGHGDSPRVVVAPHDVEGCYRLTIEAVNIAESFQTPVVLLSDQWLGQTSVATNDRFVQRDYAIMERALPDSADVEHYLRYRLSEDFVSPMAIVGHDGPIYQSTGLSHNEAGAPASDFATHQKMHEKRHRKLAPLTQRDELVRFFGETRRRLGIIAWGSAAQIVLETVSELGKQQEILVCVPELIYPLPQAVERFVNSVDRLLVVEMNYSGQLYHYLRSQTNLPAATTSCNRAGGSPFSRRELAGPITELAS